MCQTLQRLMDLHLALIAQVQQAPTNPDIGKGPRRINPDIFLDNDFTCPAIRTLYREIDEKYPKGELWMQAHVE